MIDLLIDTNVLIYAFDRDSEHHDSAKAILVDPNHNLFITTKNISEFFAVSSKFKIPLDSSMNFYEELKINSKNLFPTQKSLLIFENLIQLYQPRGNQVFDVEIVSIMLANEINLIATFNYKDFINIKEIEIFELPNA